jgi:hypothetical protein
MTKLVEGLTKAIYSTPDSLGSSSISDTPPKMQRTMRLTDKPLFLVAS